MTKGKHFGARLASGICLILSILLLTTLFMPVYSGGENSVAVSHFDIVTSTSYSPAELLEFTGKAALGDEGAAKVLLARGIAETDDSNLVLTMVAHVAVLILSLIALIVSIVGVCRRGAGGGSIAMGVLLLLASIAMILFAFMVKDSVGLTPAAGVYVALISGLALLGTSITGKVLRNR